MPDSDCLLIPFAFVFAAVPAISFSSSAQSQNRDANNLVPHIISLANGKTFSLNLPADFEIHAAAEGLKRPRFMAKSPDGRIFVTDMANLSDNSMGTVYILDHFHPQSHKFERVVPYLQH